MHRREPQACQSFRPLAGKCPACRPGADAEKDERVKAPVRCTWAGGMMRALVRYHNPLVTIKQIVRTDHQVHRLDCAQSRRMCAGSE